MDWRLMTGLGLVVAASTLVWRAFSVPWGGASEEDLLLNLGTEFIGIVVTVLIVDRLLDRQQRKQRATRIAWEALHEIDHAVWVWQGGSKEFNVSETLGLLGLARENDPLPDFTQNLLLGIAGRADNTIRLEPGILRSSKRLEAGLRSLTGLSTLRDQPEKPSVRGLAELLTGAIQDFSSLLVVVAVPMTEGLERNRDPRLEAQEWRRFGGDFRDPEPGAQNATA